VPDIQIPIGRHLFTPEALAKALTVIPQETLAPGQHGAALATVDADGVKVALLFTSKDSRWRVRGAYERDWTSDNRVAGDILYRF
jgi:hypothetical protein